MKSSPAEVHAFLGSDVCADLLAYIEAEIQLELAALQGDTYTELYDIGGNWADSTTQDGK